MAISTFKPVLRANNYEPFMENDQDTLNLHSQITMTVSSLSNLKRIKSEITFWKNRSQISHFTLTWQISWKLLWKVCKIVFSSEISAIRFLKSDIPLNCNMCPVCYSSHRSVWQPKSTYVKRESLKSIPDSGTYLTDILILNVWHTKPLFFLFGTVYIRDMLGSVFILEVSYFL